MKKQFLSIIALGAILIAGGCYYDVEEDLYPDVNCITTNQSYATDIVPILQTNCYVCHGQGVGLGNVTLQGYANLKVYVNNSKLVGVINHDSRFPAMPQGAAKLSACNIDKIEAWIADGALDN
jgi:cytochrome c553